MPLIAFAFALSRPTSEISTDAFTPCPISERPIAVAESIIPGKTVNPFPSIRSAPDGTGRTCTDSGDLTVTDYDRAILDHSP